MHASGFRTCSGNPLAMLGGICGILDLFGGVVLPADEVLRATKGAKQQPQTRPAGEEANEAQPIEEPEASPAHGDR